MIRLFGWLYDALAINNKFGWGIVLGTLIIRTCAWPVYSKSNDMTLKMSVMQPEMERIQLKYATRKDPESQQKQQIEMMRLYKKYKINPVGCIVLQALQMFICDPFADRSRGNAGKPLLLPAKTRQKGRERQGEDI